MGVISLAFEPGAGFWDWAFALADRVERPIPHAATWHRSHAIQPAPTAAGARPEVDLWPHLKGVTACVSADSHQPGRPSGGLIVLHVDTNASAERLATDVLPRLSGLLTGKKPPGDKARKEPLGKGLPAQSAHDARARGVIELGMVSGRPLRVFWRGRDVVIAWGEDALSASIEASARRSIGCATLCQLGRSRKNSPQRPARSGQVAVGPWSGLLIPHHPRGRSWGKTHRLSGGAGPSRIRPKTPSIFRAFASECTNFSTSFHLIPRQFNNARSDLARPRFLRLRDLEGDGRKTRPTLDDFIDHEFVEYCTREADDSVTLEEVLEGTSKIKQSMARTIIEDERAERS